MQKDCTPWSDYTADVWQRVIVNDLKIGQPRFEVAIDATERCGPLLVLFLDEHTVQLSMMQKHCAAYVYAFFGSATRSIGIGGMSNWL